MEPVSVPEGAVLLLAEVMERVGISYAVMGGLALNAWGVPRATYDLDATLAVEPTVAARALAAIQGNDVDVDESFLKGYVDELAGMKKAAVKLRSGGAWFTVDLFFATTPFLQSTMQRRVALQVRNRVIWIITAADLILFKLIAGRRKDWVDIDSILAVQGVPEEEYLRAWAEKLGVKPRLEQVLREARGG